MKTIDVPAALGYKRAHKCTGRKRHEYLPYQGAANEMHSVYCIKCGRRVRLYISTTMTYD